MVDQAGIAGTWDDARYSEIVDDVYRHVPRFDGPVIDIAAEPYSSLVRLETEVYADGNLAGDPASTDSPLIMRERPVWYYGDAIAAAIAECHRRGGGTVLIPPDSSRNPDGAHYTGAIRLLSGVQVRVEAGVTVKFMRNIDSRFYPAVRTSYQGSDLYSMSPLVYAYGARNVGISGGGTLDGQEDLWNWRPFKKGYWGCPDVEGGTPAPGLGDLNTLLGMNVAGVAVEERIFTASGARPATIERRGPDGTLTSAPLDESTPVYRSTFRPSFIQTFECENVLIEGIKIRNAPFWIVHPVSSRRVMIRDLDVFNDRDVLGFEPHTWNNDDGIDPESCENVVIERCRINVNDDGVAVKSGRDRDGRERREPCNGLVIRDCHVRNDTGNSAGISMGSEVSGGVRDVFVHDVVFDGRGLMHALKIKTNATRGGAIEDIHLRDCTVHQVGLSLIQLDTNYGIAPPIPGTDIHDPVIRRISVVNVSTVAPVPAGVPLFTVPSSVSRSPVSSVRYAHATFHAARAGSTGLKFGRFVRDVILEDVTFADPVTRETETYSSKPLEFVDLVVRDDRGVGLPVPGGGDPVAVTGRFTVEGRVTWGGEPVEGEVRLHVDRDAEGVVLTADAEGRFTSDPIDPDRTGFWYAGITYAALHVAIDGMAHTEVVRVTA
ncbi:glycoside hydrolase family 28 protein [Demequina sp. NBRC 110055]|uniref:glycoside hydrolase family 28 protein n=1 Tax=Demequina sp. NBRC 110055 TaxID=1570344 RepID=UPI001356379E|nr:glycosyl hydrolase family 28 protein [Demequina sp. NBRC 110055]